MIPAGLRISMSGASAHWGIMDNFVYFYYKGAMVLRCSKIRIEDEPLEWLAADLETQCGIRDRVLNLEHWMKEFFK